MVVVVLKCEENCLAQRANVKRALEFPGVRSKRACFSLGTGLKVRIRNSYLVLYLGIGLSILKIQKPFRSLLVNTNGTMVCSSCCTVLPCFVAVLPCLTIGFSRIGDYKGIITPALSLAILLCPILQVHISAVILYIQSPRPMEPMKYLFCALVTFMLG